MKYLCLICILVLFSCEKSSKIKSFEVELEADFTELLFDSHFEVYLTQGTENSLQVECTEKIFSKLSFKTEDSMLKIKNKAKFTWVRPKKNDVILHITVKNLKKIVANESCDIRSVGVLKFNDLGVIFASKLNNADLEIDCNAFYYWNNFPCGGKLTIRGKTNQLSCWNFALMQVDASQCKAKNVLVENSSKGDCSFAISEKIEYSILGEGNINCYGNPSEIIRKTSSGKGQFKVN